jgi:hypothetical protein
MTLQAEGENRIATCAFYLFLCGALCHLYTLPARPAIARCILDLGPYAKINTKSSQLGQSVTCCLQQKHDHYTLLGQNPLRTHIRPSRLWSHLSPQVRVSSAFGTPWGPWGFQPPHPPNQPLAPVAHLEGSQNSSPSCLVSLDSHMPPCGTFLLSTCPVSNLGSPLTFHHQA